MSNPSVQIDYRGRVAQITLNRPEAYNSFNHDLRAGMLRAVNTLKVRNDIRVVILTANGKGFCAGADLREGIPPAVSQQIHDEYEPFLLGLRRLDQVVLAVVNGACAGIGCGLLAATDLAVMAEDAYLQLAFSKIALVPDGGVSWELVRAVGYKRAFRLLMDAGRLSAQECLHYGIVNEVVSSVDLQTRAWQWAEQIAELSPTANTLTKRVLRQALELSLPATIAFEAQMQDIASTSADCIEGINAFLEKRKPNYPGK